MAGMRADQSAVGAINRPLHQVRWSPMGILCLLGWFEAL